MFSYATRDATIILSDFFMEFGPNERMASIKATHKMIREWYLAEWALMDKSLDVPC
jgi:hypothetical protein